MKAAERETLVNATDADDMVRVWTPRYLGRLRRNPAFIEVKSGRFGATEWAEFVIEAAKWAPDTGVRHSRQLSDEQREASRARMATLRASQLAEQHAEDGAA